jgi:hypothetical protein
MCLQQGKWVMFDCQNQNVGLTLSLMSHCVLSRSLYPKCRTTKIVWSYYILSFWSEYTKCITWSHFKRFSFFIFLKNHEMVNFITSTIKFNKIWQGENIDKCIVVVSYIVNHYCFNVCVMRKDIASSRSKVSW